MNYFNTHSSLLLASLVPVSLLLGGAVGPVVIQHSESEHQEHQGQGEAAMAEPSLMDQIAEIRASVARLEAALDRNHEAMSSNTGASSSSMGDGSMGGMGGMGGMDKMAGMGGMDKMAGMGGMDKMAGMGGMGGMDKMAGMGGMDKMAGMGGMDKMGGMGGMGSMGSLSGGSSKGMQMMGRLNDMGRPAPLGTISALPGFPGASHIYHIGAAGFFLDHGQHIELSVGQRSGLAQVQEQAVLEQSSYDRRIEQAEQELWVLTSAAEPDASAVDAKVREIASLTADQRISFIRSVGKAAGILTAEQRSVLVGEPGTQMPDSGANSDSDHDH